MSDVPAAFTIAFAPGVTLTRWTRAWGQRQRSIPLAFIPTDAATQVTVLREALADVSFVRLPVDRAGLSVIPLYEEQPVVVLPREHDLARAETITLAELENADRVSVSLSDQDAVELVAAGGGIVILPQSIARMHDRKDVVAVPVADALTTTIAIAWLESNTTVQVEEFVGIVRGRTAASSRLVPTPKTEKPKKVVKPAKAGPARPKTRPRKPRGR